MIVFRWLSIIMIVIAVMLLGGDLMTTLEKKVVVIRSLNDVMLLFGYDARAILFESLPSLVFAVVNSLISWPGWLIMAFWGFVSAVIAPAPRAVRPLPPPPPIPR